MANVRDLSRQLHQVFLDAASKRPLRSDLVDVGGRSELGWVVFERDTMFDAVTRERAKLGKAPVPMKDVERVETMAMGHCDYSSKFALYCAELVVNTP